MPTCPGCAACTRPDSYLECPTCDTRPYVVYAHREPGRTVNRTEIRPRDGAPPLVRRGVHAVCPRCDGELVRR